jgi:hypothetical protein
VRAAAAAAPRLARRTRIRHGEPPRKPGNIAEWTLGSNFTEPKSGRACGKFKVFWVLAPPLPLRGARLNLSAGHGIRCVCWWLVLPREVDST